MFLNLGYSNHIKMLFISYPVQNPVLHLDSVDCGLLPLYLTVEHLMQNWIEIGDFTEDCCF